MVPVVLVQYLLLTPINSPACKNYSVGLTSDLQSTLFLVGGAFESSDWTRRTERPHIWRDVLLLSVLEKRDLGQRSVAKTHLWKKNTQPFHVFHWLQTS